MERCLSRGPPPGWRLRTDFSEDVAIWLRGKVFKGEIGGGEF